MAIIHCRIDYRLIHGQVATLWTNHLNSTRIMVIDDATSTNDIRKSALKLACPPGVSLSVLSVEKAAENIKSGKYDSQRVMIILGSIESLNDLFEHGVEIKEVNLGNLQKNEETKFIKPTVPITLKEAEIIMHLYNKGVGFTYQLIPGRVPEEVIPSVKKEFGL